MNTIANLVYSVLLNACMKIGLWLIGGTMPTNDPEKCRKWVIKNLDRGAFIAGKTPTKLDNQIIEIVRSVVNNDTSWNIAFSLFSSGEPIPEETINGTESGPLKKLRSKLSLFRSGDASGEYSTDEEAESVTLVVAILGILANGPGALTNIKALIERIKLRKNDK